MQLFFYALYLYCILEVFLVVLKQFLRPKNFPPGPKWYIPFIGNSRFLRNLSKKHGGQYEAFTELTKQYNSPIISLKLGSELVIFVSTYQLIKEIHTRSEFDGRPDNYFLRLRTMGSRLGITCTDGTLWQEQRAFLIKQLRNVGFGRSKMEICIEKELKEILQSIDDDKVIWGGENNFIATSVINILWTFTCGAQFQRDDARLKRLLMLLNKRAKAFDMSGGLLSQMPFLRFIAPEKTGYNLIRNLNSEFSKLFMEIISDHERNYSADKANDDVVYAFLSEMKSRNNQENSTFTIKQLVVIILDIFIAGATTTSTTIDLILMALLLYPDTQKKCREEILKVSAVNSDDINYSNRHLLPYTVATILEVERYFHLLPITGPRRVMSNCKLNNYDIPKNVTILIGHRSIYNDVDFWKDPENFRPERFLDSEMNIIPMLRERVLTFGSGKRRCIGDQLAKECIFTFIVGILKKYTLHKCEGAEPDENLLPGIIHTPKRFKISFEKN